MAVLQGAPELVVHRMLGGRHELSPLSYGTAFEKIPGVGQVLPRYWGYYYDNATGANYTLMGVTGKTRETSTLVEGVLIEPGQRGVCVIGQGVSDARLLDVGGKFPVIDAEGTLRTLQIIGIFTDASALLTNDLILLNPEELKEIFRIPQGMVTDFVVQVHNPSEINNVARKIKYAFPDTRPISRSEIIRTYDALFSWRGGLILVMFFAAVVAFSILAWDKATGLSAEERKEVGILKAIGWETSDILELKFWEGVVISSLSFLTGIIAAYAHVFFFGASLFAPALKGWSVLFPDFKLVPHIDLYQLFVLLFLTVLPYIVATIVPSWKTAITDPDIVMRG